MATAVETGSESRTPSPPSSLPIASLIGAVYVVAALAGVFYAVPTIWKDSITPHISNSFVDVALRLVVQLGIAGGMIWFGRKLLGAAPPKGVRGGIFLMISVAVVTFFIWRWTARRIDGMPGMIISGLVAAFLIYLAVRFFLGKIGERWMVGLEEQGWFHSAPYKRTLGQKVRRLTILGILIIGGTGAYTLRPETGMLPQNWTLAMPFDLPNITLLHDAQYAIPLLILGLTLWLAYRAVNVPNFAEFLVATEAEMNKVSWTPKKRLAQDTVVVLTTTLLLTLFLLVVDLFWGWLLSRPQVGVLPAPAKDKEKGGQVQQTKW